MIAIMNPASIDPNIINSLKRSSSDEFEDDEHLEAPAAKRKRAPVASIPKKKAALCYVDEPHAHDVLSGRGGLINKHPGNVAFRRVVEANKQTYHSCKKEHKLLLSQSIVEAVQNQNPSGRFLAQEKGTGRWYDVGKARAIQKTSQGLREGADKIRKDLMGTGSDSAGSGKGAEAKRKHLPTQEEINEEVLRRASLPNPEAEPIIPIIVPPRYPAPENMEEYDSKPTPFASEPDDANQATSTDNVSTTNSNTSVVIEEDTTDAARDSSELCLADLDSLDLFSDDTIFDNLSDDDGLGALFGIPPAARVLNVYAGIPLVDAESEDQQDDGEEAETRGNTRADHNAQTGAQATNDSSDECVSVVSLDRYNEDMSSTDDDTEDLLKTALIPGLDESKCRAIWEL